MLSLSRVLCESIGIILNVSIVALERGVLERGVLKPGFLVGAAEAQAADAGVPAQLGAGVDHVVVVRGAFRARVLHAAHRIENLGGGMVVFDWGQEDNTGLHFGFGGREEEFFEVAWERRLCETCYHWLQVYSVELGSREEGWRGVVAGGGCLGGGGVLDINVVVV